MVSPGKVSPRGVSRSKASRSKASRVWIAVAVLGALALSIAAANVHALSVGARAPEIGLRDLSGNQVSIASLRGRVVIVDFWASWCAPCREEMPVLNSLHQRYGSRGLSIVGVSQDRNVANARSFVAQHRVAFPVVHDASQAVARRYQPPRMPSSYVIDRNGVVRHVHAGFRAADAAALEREVSALLAQR